ncbi:MAG: fructose-6-phosphate aldolase [Erysipelotrichaceae bacterium]|nr:fructose-6-phosphate aldolase [Erysipelotrichaceae bacterium]
MKLFIDDADIEAIKRLIDLYPIDGVTTNPTILARTGKEPKEVLSEIRTIIGEERTLFVQAVPLDAEGIIEDARKIVAYFGKNTIVKIPSIPEGFKAIRELKIEGIHTCGTIVYTPLQGYLAAKAGADYVAPYVNRIDNMGYDGITVTKKMQDIMENHGYDCTVLAASFRNSNQVLELCEYGVGAVTCATDVIDNFVKNVAIDKVVDDFVKDFEKLTGKHSMKDVL